MDNILIPMPETPQATRINDQCCIRDVEQMRTVVVLGMALFRYDRDDKLSERNAAVTLTDEGWATQQEVAGAFGVATATLRRWQRRHDAQGLRGLERKPRQSPLLKMGGARDRVVRRLFAEGQSNCAIARQLGVSEHAVRYALKRLGLKRKKERHPELGVATCAEANQQVAEGTEVAADLVVPPAASQVREASGIERQDICSEPVDGHQPEPLAAGRQGAAGGRAEPVTSGGAGQTVREEAVGAGVELELTESLDADASDRRMDRLMASLGLLQDAVPLFQSTSSLCGGGVLLAVPLIVLSGALEAFGKTYRSLGPAFYGLRTTLMSLFVMALLRIKRPENIKERSPEALGQLIGLDRFPEVKTLRRKLAVMAQRGQARKAMAELARRRMKKREKLLGFLYVDGHVREYHGKGKLAKAYVVRRRLAAKGTTDTWVNDASGEPLFLVTSDLNEQLSQMLEPVLDQVEELLGGKRRLTVAFDRGGWNLKLFVRLVERGYDILTYRKGRFEPLPTECFSERRGTVEGKELSYLLHEMSVRMGNTKVRRADGTEAAFWMRQVTRLKDGHQTPVLTTRQDLDAVEVLGRMFNRWRQENYFKYMREEYLLDALVDYNLEPVEEKLDRPNPERVAVDKELRTARRQLKSLEAELGEEAFYRSLGGPKNLPELSDSHAELVQEILDKENQITRLMRRRAKLPERVSACGVQRLARERKLITDTIKTAAYQIETRMVDMVRDHYARVDDEGRKLIVSALASDAKLEVTDEQLRVTIAPQSSPHRSRAIEALCQQLNAMEVRFPGTKLTLHYAQDGV